MSLVGRLIALRGVRIATVCGVVMVAAVIGIGTQLHSLNASSATYTSAGTNGISCSGKPLSSASASSCSSGNDLLANSITRAASVALQPTAAPGSAAKLTAYTDQPANTAGQPCHDSYMFVPNITEWTVPPGCYATIFTPDPSQYSAPSTFGYCNWWVEALHPKQQDILSGSEYTRSAAPIVGSAMWFPPNVQGASAAGHWAQVVAIAPDHYWVLITEMNFGWRGGGFGRVDYRYAHVDANAGVAFVH
ncbi:MAG TPA: hypothetical protein VFU63_13795 [Ktedonobacterales bacterium]|nr:hypothetical protein [Ktedonobacterales bacterium]